LLLAFGLSYAGFYLDLAAPFLNFLAKNSLILLFLSVVFFLEKDQISGFLKRKPLR